jgi:choline transport protein
MDINKSGSDTHVSYNDLNGNDVELRNTAKLRGTEHDENDMRTLGKTQQLNVSEVRCFRAYSNLCVQRNFRFLSILAFSCSAMSTWEFSLA